MDISLSRPTDGQKIVACNSLGACWVEEFDSSEPIGAMVAWYPISDNQFHYAHSPLAMAQLFVYQTIHYKG